MITPPNDPDHWDLVEGQGSLSHPRYSAVTLGLLHGCIPHGMILVYEAGRKNVHGMDYIPLVPLKKIVEVNETMASLAMPTRAEARATIISRTCLSRSRSSVTPAARPRASFSNSPLLLA